MAEILVHAQPVIVTGPFLPYGSVYGRSTAPATVLHTRVRVPISEIGASPVILVPGVTFARVRIVDLTLIAVGDDVTGGQVHVRGTQNGVVVNLFAATPADLQQSVINLPRQLAGLANGACFAPCDLNTPLYLGANVLLAGDALDVGLSFVAELAVPI